MLVFNFHHVEEKPADTSRELISITPDGLRGLIRTMRGLGWEIISLAKALQEPQPCRKNSRQLIITFDDGFSNNYHHAAPVLVEEKCPATIFVLPGLLNGHNNWDSPDEASAHRDPLMSGEQMQELAQTGYFTFGSHGMTHRDMSRLSEEELHYEIHESFHILSQTLGKSFLPALAYPWGYHSSRTIKSLESSPYRFAFTVEKKAWLPGHHPYKVPRYSVYGRDENKLILFSKLLRHGILF